MGEDQEARIKELEQELKIKELEQKLNDKVDKPIDVNITEEDWTKNLIAFVIIAFVVMVILYNMQESKTSRMRKPETLN